MNVLFLQIFNTLLDFFPLDKTPITINRPRIEHNTVAHAFGELNGQKYLNTKEAFEANYQKGVRLFEADFWLTSDNKVVLFHEGFEDRFGLKKGFSEQDFLATRPFDSTTLNLQGLSDLLKKYPDALLITDVKNHNVKIINELVKVLKENGLDYKNRIIPQIYNPYEYDELREFSFNRFIFTLYRFKNKKKQVSRFIRRTPEIAAVTLQEKRLDQDYLEMSKRDDIDLFIHTVNSEERKQELFKKGIKGIYTDRLF